MNGKKSEVVTTSGMNGRRKMPPMTIHRNIFSDKVMGEIVASSTLRATPLSSLEIL
jgi:hypothetical protein